jgi:nitrite reductase/ring-hydroxylating ferredoxin subunit
MTRYHFLKSLGFTGGALMAILTSCTKEEDYITSAIYLKPNIGENPVDTNIETSNATTEFVNSIKSPKVKLDLTLAANANLIKVGGYLVSNNIVIALLKAGTYAAVTRTCTHEPKNQVIYLSGEFYCTAHGARFSTVGKGLNSLGSKGITTYKVASDGKTLVVYV